MPSTELISIIMFVFILLPNVADRDWKCVCIHEIQLFILQLRFSLLSKLQVSFMFVSMKRKRSIPLSGSLPRHSTKDRSICPYGTITIIKTTK